VRALLKILFFLSFAGLAVGTVTAVSVWYVVWPTLPNVESLRHVELQTPLRIYSADGQLMREFGEKRRVPLATDEVPEILKNAVIATEDRNFRGHFGVDPAGIARAVLHIIREGRKGPGGSTITMQVARNFFLDPGKTYIRKLKEISLAVKIEQELSKDEIMGLYLNKIFLGHRAYGVGAAAQVYYGKRIEDLSLAQLAMVAGLPQRPSDFNPVTNPAKALDRRNHVLTRLRKENYISQEDLVSAAREPLTARLHASPVTLSAPYVAEMARQSIKRTYGAGAFSDGLKVYTSLNSSMQRSADAALRGALVAYDKRHGWRGPELKLGMDAATLAAMDVAQLDRALTDIPELGGLSPAVVLEVLAKGARLHVRGRGEIALDWKAISWAKRYINTHRVGKSPKRAADLLAVGDVVRVYPDRVDALEKSKGEKAVVKQVEKWQLSQLPQVEGAFVALDPETGAVLALAGGFDFKRSKFNRVMQAYRQPGSSFKPFIYSAALEKGFTAASTINDAPIVFDDEKLESAWRPQNYSGKSFGPTRLRYALTKSRNLVSIRLLRAVGIGYALEHLDRFSIDTKRLPRDLSISLGSGVVRPIDIATGYSVIANGGYQVAPFVIQRVEDADGNVLFEANPPKICRTCEQPDPQLITDTPAEDAPTVRPSVVPSSDHDPSLARRVLPEANAWIMYSMMRDVVRAGTAVKALSLKRPDIAGKTGTTNDQRDAWFSGFSPSLVATAWVGFDRVKPMGRAETGGTAALPMWIDFMREAMKLAPYDVVKITEPPADMVTVRIDADTGLLANASTVSAMVEYFRPDHAPNRNPQLRAAAAAASSQKEAKDLSEKIW
jgi:penicillin-binding protein 1A